MNIEIHPAAAIFPMMTPDELRDLADDIKKNGLIEPIIIHEYKILDGRNRLAACDIAGVEPRYVEVKDIASATRFAVSKNLHRRHLTTSQKAAVAAEMVPLLAEEAKKRSLENLQNQPKSSTGSKDPIEETGRANEIAARTLGISESSVKRAVKVKRENPEVFEKVKRGEITVNAAADGHMEQPRRLSFTEKSPAQSTPKAEVLKRKMVDGLSVIGGVCYGLQRLDVLEISKVCTPDEIASWATKAQGHARDLRKFAAMLKGEADGK